MISVYKYIAIFSIVIGVASYIKYEIIGKRDNKIESLQEQLDATSNELNECLLKVDSVNLKSYIEGVERESNSSNTFTFHT